MEVASLVLGLLSAFLAFLAWRVSRPATQWQVVRMDVGQYKLTRTGIMPARVVELHIQHDGSPTTVGHASGSATSILFRRGDSIHFSYSIPEGAELGSIDDEIAARFQTMNPLELRGRELDIRWCRATRRRGIHRGRFRDLGRQRLTTVILD